MSILVPAHNEAVTISDSVRALLQLEYPEYEVVVVNDGSTDNTIRTLMRDFALVPVPRQAVRQNVKAEPALAVYQSLTDPRLLVIDKANSGKGSSLNTALNYAQYPWVCTIDADSLLERDALLRVARLILQNPSEVVAVGGVVRVANGSRIHAGHVVETRLPSNLLAVVQLAEYIKTFTGGRVAWSAVNGLAIISGAFGVFRRDLMVAIGGYSPGRPGEDMEIVLKLHAYCRRQRLRYRIAFCPDAVCWTQAPDTLSVLGNQRRRWGRGNLRNVRAFSFMVFRPRYGAIGLLSLPYLMGVELLAPYMMFVGLLVVLAVALRVPVHGSLLWLLLAVGFMLDYLLGVTAVAVDDLMFRWYRRRDVLKLFVHLLHMPLWYYFLTAAWRVQGHIQMVRRINPWGAMTRQGWGR